MIQELYNSIYAAYQRGDISKELWCAFHDELFNKLLAEIEESLTKIKESLT